MVKKRKIKKINITSSETKEEFLARGGEVQRIETIEPEVNRLVKLTNPGPPKLHTLPEAAFMFGETTRRKKKSAEEIRKKKLEKIDKSLLPDKLKDILGI